MRASRTYDPSAIPLPCPRPRKRNPAYTIGVFGAPKVGVTSILDMVRSHLYCEDCATKPLSLMQLQYIFGTIIDHAIEGFGFANPHQITIDVERVSPYTERTANMIVSKIAHNKLPQELSDLIVEKVIDLQRLNKQTCKVEMRQLRLRPEYPTLHHYQLRSCDGILLIYDVTSRESFEYIQTLYDDVKKVFRVALDLRPFPFPLCVVANKVDLSSTRKVSAFEGRAFAETINRPYSETSIRDFKSMERAMHGITKAIYLYEELPLQFWRKPVVSEDSSYELDAEGIKKEEGTLIEGLRKTPQRNWLNCKVLQNLFGDRTPSSPDSG